MSHRDMPPTLTLSDHKETHMFDFLDTWTALSSTGLVGGTFDLLEGLGKWTEAVAKLIGLVK